ncbi:polysaccharide deacetylase family protein [Aquimarina algiphila]|uniref:Polysaccharide deacetylase family protein n=1 Tax=Aquimarina algiphila TaxID=2047982 RepID=A0A554VEC7_9FLAO|nr:polysaccharide deacetylase family protein [Aquimarina algiphila]TSE05355.1 polysaccharide deacetylase family protein [Aquimarina algiphila]
MMKFRIITTLSIVAILGLLASNLYFGSSWLWILLPITIWLLVTAIGSFIMSYNYFLTSFISSNSIISKKIALTFDDGPHPELTYSILDVLDRFNAKATFFCIGKQIEKYPEVLKEIAKRGHAIGNHSYSHSNFIDFSSQRKWLEEIRKTDSIIKKSIGESSNLFRPPFGVTTPNLAKAIKETKHHVIGWDNRSFDTVLKNKTLVLKRIVKHISPGGIILFHDTQPNTVYVLERLLIHLKQHQFEAVTINNLLDEM